MSPNLCHHWLFSLQSDNWYQVQWFSKFQLKLSSMHCNGLYVPKEGEIMICNFRQGGVAPGLLGPRWDVDRRLPLSGSDFVAMIESCRLEKVNHKESNEVFSYLGARMELCLMLTGGLGSSLCWEPLARLLEPDSSSGRIGCSVWGFLGDCSCSESTNLEYDMINFDLLGFKQRNDHFCWVIGIWAKEWICNSYEDAWRMGGGKSHLEVGRKGV